MLQVVIGNPWCNGKDFSERIWANREALAQTLQNEIANGLIRGEDYKTMSRILQQKFENTSQKQAERLVFTEDTYLSNEAKIRPFERNAAYTHYEYLCVEDHRTCETCRALSGQTFEISKRNAGLNFPPMHPWCRCTVMPVVEDLEMIKSRLTSGGNDGKIEVRFETPEKMQKHYDKHIDKYGNISISEYIALANELVNAKDTDDIERIVRSDESTAIYRFSTNDFLVITKDGYIRTFFKPDDGEAYWREEHERN